MLTKFNTKIKSGIARGRQGQSMVEFAFAIPFLLLMVVATVFFGRYFLIAQVLLYAAQEGAKVASRTPNLDQQSVRDSLRGFTVGGSELNPNSIIYTALASGKLLSNGTSGNLPPGSLVQILPWDGTTNTTTPQGTVQVSISYPFQLIGNPFGAQSPNVKIAMSFTGSGVTFGNFNISQSAVAAQEVYQSP